MGGGARAVAGGSVGGGDKGGGDSLAVPHLYFDLPLCASVRWVSVHGLAGRNMIESEEGEEDEEDEK